MTVTVSVPAEWPSGIAARSGLAPRNAIPRVLDARCVWLSARRRYTMFVPLHGGTAYPLTESHASETDRETIRVQIPPWTRSVRWWVLTSGDAESATCSTYRSDDSGEDYRHKMPCQGLGGRQLQSATLLPSAGIPDADDLPQYIDAGGERAATWLEIEVDLWLDSGAEIYGVVFEALPQATISQV